MKNRLIAGIAALLALTLLCGCGGYEPTDNNTEIEQVIQVPQTEEPELPAESPSPAPDTKVADKAPETEVPPTPLPEREEEVVKDEPLEPEESDTPDAVLTCSLSVRCDSVLKNIEKLHEGKREIIPPDGIIFKEQLVEFSEGESVFDVMLREMKENKIHFEFVHTPMYNSVYIEGIGNLYQFDCGDYSGWMYKVNGVSPTYGCSQYKVKNGDRIEFYYSCNLLGG